MGRITRDDMITIRKKLDEIYGADAKVILGIITYNYGLGLSQSELKTAVLAQAATVTTIDENVLSLIVAIIF